MISEIDIKAIRKTLKLSQEELAEKLGVHEMTVSRWERKTAKPSMLAIRQINRLMRKRGISDASTS